MGLPGAHQQFLVEARVGCKGLGGSHKGFSWPLTPALSRMRQTEEKTGVYMEPLGLWAPGAVGLVGFTVKLAARMVLSWGCRVSSPCPFLADICPCGPTFWMCLCFLGPCETGFGRDHCICCRSCIPTSLGLCHPLPHPCPPTSLWLFHPLTSL